MRKFVSFLREKDTKLFYPGSKGSNTIKDPYQKIENAAKTGCSSGRFRWLPRFNGFVLTGHKLQTASLGRKTYLVTQQSQEVTDSEPRKKSVHYVEKYHEMDKGTDHATDRNSHEISCPKQNGSVYRTKRVSSISYYICSEILRETLPIL